MMTISIICGISILLNCFLIWYIREILTKLLFISENQQRLSEVLTSFSSHLDSIYELETFYGDETLQSLMAHSNSLLDTLEDFREIYTLFNAEREEELIEEVDLDKNEEK